MSTIHESAAALVRRWSGACLGVLVLAAAASLLPVPTGRAGQPVDAELPAAPGETFPAGRLIEGVHCRTDPTQTYTLRLPEAYTPERTWPLLLILDPRGRSVQAAERFSEGAERFGWILVASNDTRSDGPIEPNLVALNALWPEINTRFAVDRRRIYAAGFSGGAHFAWLLGKRSGGLAGVIASGGRLIEENLEGTSFALLGAAGTTDFNFLPMRRVEAFVSEQGNHHRFEVFDGPHQWMPAEMATRAIEWMEVEAMRQGLRTADLDIVEHQYRHDMATVERLIADGEHLSALRLLQAVARDLEGLHPGAGKAAERAAALVASPEVRRQLDEERRWESYEEGYLQRLRTVAQEVRGSELIPALPRVLRDLKVSAVHRHAEAPGIEGITGQRLINTALTQMSFYLAAEMRAARRYDRLELVLEIAVELDDTSPVVHYNLACAHALAGRPADAFEALETALVLGFADRDLLATDRDLDPLRSDPRLAALLARLGGTRVGEPTPETLAPESGSEAPVAGSQSSPK